MALKSKYADVSIPETLSWPDFVFRDFEKYGNQTAIVSRSTRNKFILGNNYRAIFIFQL